MLHAPLGAAHDRYGGLRLDSSESAAADSTLPGVFPSAAVLSKKSSDSVSKNLLASQMELAPFGSVPPVKAQVAIARKG